MLTDSTQYCNTTLIDGLLIDGLLIDWLLIDGLSMDRLLTKMLSMTVAEWDVILVGWLISGIKQCEKTVSRKSSV